jgi:hypothetical protein
MGRRLSIVRNEERSPQADWTKKEADDEPSASSATSRRSNHASAKPAHNPDEDKHFHQQAFADIMSREYRPDPSKPLGDATVVAACSATMLAKAVSSVPTAGGSAYRCPRRLNGPMHTMPARIDVGVRSAHLGRRRPGDGLTA